MTPRDLFLTLNAIRITMADSERLDQIHVVEETTGRAAFRRIHERLKSTAEGRALLAKRPELKEDQVDLDALRKLPRSRRSSCSSAFDWTARRPGTRRVRCYVVTRHARAAFTSLAPERRIARRDRD